MPLETLSLTGTSPWFEKPQIDIYISKKNKKETTQDHRHIIQALLTQHRRKYAIAYTDGSKIDGQVGAGLFTFHNNQEQGQKWRLGNSFEVYDVELFAISQAVK